MQARLQRGATGRASCRLTVAYAGHAQCERAACPGSTPHGHRSITQTGGACGYSLNAYGALFGTTGGTGSVLGLPTALGCVPATGTAEPNVLTLSPLVGPVSNIFTQGYAVAPFNVLTPVVRKAYIIFGGQIFTVKQTSW